MSDWRSDEEVETEERLEEPGQYKVLLHNDNYTPMNFVVEVIVKVFQKGVTDATKLMLQVHRNGKAVVGLYTWDVAASKVDRVHREAKEAGFPLRASMEPS